MRAKRTPPNTAAEMAPSRTPSLIVIVPTKFRQGAGSPIAIDVPQGIASDHQVIPCPYGGAGPGSPGEPTKFATPITKMAFGPAPTLCATPPPPPPRHAPPPH